MLFRSGKASVVKLGKDTLGFQLDGRDGGSGGEKGDISWVYSVDNKMKIVTGCHNEEWRFEPLSVECEPKINSNLKSTEEFYPIELNYKLVRYKLNDKAQVWIANYVLVDYGTGAVMGSDRKSVV